MASDTSFVVINERRVVLGRYRTGGESRAVGIRIEEAIQPGPTTVRAHEPLDPLLERMARRGVNEVIVTTPEGELLGEPVPDLQLPAGGDPDRR